MKRIIYAVLLAFVFCTTVAYAGLLDNVMKSIGSPAGEGPNNDTVVNGLKEALSIGTENAVKNVSQTDGYFGSKMIKILMPDKIQKVADVLFYMVGQEEKKIRTDPAARVTDLLKTVFGK